MEVHKWTLMSMIFLIGMPACGKTYWGKQLADRLGYIFGDTDQLIVENEGSGVSEIFNSKGEEYFRKLEQKALDRIIDEYKDKDIVVACGGGLPAFEDNLDKIKAHGYVVYLETDINTLAERIKQERYQRPMFANSTNIADTLEALYEARMPYYLGAHLIADVTEITIDSLIKTLKECTNRQ